MNDPVFTGAVVCITELNENGAIGFVVNKKHPRSLNELEELATSPAFPLYDGGPVDQEHLFFIHRRPDLVPGSNAVSTDLYEGGDFAATVQSINKNLIDSSDLKIFVGYCGWDAGELEAEIAEGSWEVEELSLDEIFNTW